MDAPHGIDHHLRHAVGFAFGEWKLASSGAKALVRAEIGLLVIATIVVGYGNMLAI